MKHLNNKKIKQLVAYDKSTKLGEAMLTLRTALSIIPEAIALKKLQSSLGVVSVSIDNNTSAKGMMDKVAPYKRQPLTGTGLRSYMANNNLNTPVEIIKSYKKDKSLKMKDFNHLVITLRQMNISPNETLEYVCEAIRDNVQRYVYHRIEKEFIYNNGKALVDLVEYYYDKQKESKKNSISWLHQSKYLKDWANLYQIELLGYDHFLKMFNKMKHHYDMLVKNK